MWLAGDALDRDDYRALAVSAMEAVFRRPVIQRNIDSPTFCHGIAGLLAVSFRFANDTGADVFIDGAGPSSSSLSAVTGRIRCSAFESRVRRSRG